MTHDELDAQLRERLGRREAPAGFAERVAEAARKDAEERAKPRKPQTAPWARVAAIAAMLTVAVGGGIGTWRHHAQEQQRRGDEAKRQLMLALRITSEKLGVVQNALDRSTH